MRVLTYWEPDFTSTSVTLIDLLSGSEIANSVASTATACDVIKSAGTAVMFQMEIVLESNVLGALPSPNVISTAISYSPYNKKPRHQTALLHAGDAGARGS